MDRTETLHVLKAEADAAAEAVIAFEHLHLRESWREGGELRNEYLKLVRAAEGAYGAYAETLYGTE